MPDPLFGLITPACYDTLLVQRDLLGPAGIDCAKKVVAKLLGTAILFGSFALKLPQIFKILKARSALGLNPTSQYLEASALRASTLRPPCSLTPRAVLTSPPQIPMYTLSLLYPMLLGYPFSSYGETAVILLQQAVVVALIIAFAEKPPARSRCSERSARTAARATRSSPCCRPRCARSCRPRRSSSR